MGPILRITKSESPSLFQKEWITRCEAVSQQSEDGPARRPFFLSPDLAGKSFVASVCVYELAAISSRGKLPMISTLCRQRRWFEASLLVVFLMHLHHEEVMSYRSSRASQG